MIRVSEDRLAFACRLCRLWITKGFIFSFFREGGGWSRVGLSLRGDQCWRRSCLFPFFRRSWFWTWSWAYRKPAYYLILYFWLNLFLCSGVFAGLAAIPAMCLWFGGRNWTKCLFHLNFLVFWSPLTFRNPFNWLCLLRCWCLISFLTLWRNQFVCNEGWASGKLWVCSDFNQLAITYYFLRDRLRLRSMALFCWRW